PGLRAGPLVHFRQTTPVRSSNPYNSLCEPHTCESRQESIAMKRMSAFLVTLLMPLMLPAAEPALIPRKALFGNPVKAGPQISPDGKTLAYIAPDGKDVLQVWVRGI